MQMPIWVTGCSHVQRLLAFGDTRGVEIDRETCTVGIVDGSTALARA